MRERRIPRRRVSAQLADVDGSRDVRVAMPEHERHLIDALAGKESAACDRVPETGIEGTVPCGTLAGRPA